MSPAEPVTAVLSAAEATAALLRTAGGDQAIPLVFDGAAVSQAALGDRTREAPWWDAAAGGVRLAGLALAGASFRHADLSGADLTGADLEAAQCVGIRLHRARLEQVNLRGADLIGGTLTEVDAGQANLAETLLEDADLGGARLRFANLTGSVLDGANLDRADLWGAKLGDAAAERASFRAANLDEASMAGADLAAANLTGASLRRANLAGANLRGAVLRDAVLDGAVLAGADLAGAVLPHVSLTGCDLQGVRFAGAWLERTRMRAHQVSGGIGEELAGEFAAALEGYIVLEQNFRTLGSGIDASWAFRRRRRMGKRLNAQQARAALAGRQPVVALRCGLRWLADVAAEWTCDYGESVTRVLRTLLTILVAFAGLYWVTGCLVPREGAMGGVGFVAVDYLLFSIDSMTTVGTSEVGLRAGGQLGVFLSSVETVIGTILLGLFGFVLGVRMRN